MPSVREILGVPALPPARATTATTRLRAGLARLHAALAPPPLRVVETMLTMLDPALLVALCALDVPDRLTDRTTIDTLARDVGAPRDRVERLLRAAATRRWVRVDRHGRVSPTRALRFLRRDHPGGWRAWVDFAGGHDVVTAVRGLDTAIRGDDPFAVANGTPFFEWMAGHPERQRAFDDAMAAGARMHGLVLANALDWSDVREVCDVGGGTGELLATLVEAHDHLDGVLFDLPHVVARAENRPQLRTVGGDAFERVPAGCDVYLLVNVIHDWGDDDASRLLERVHDAAAAGARVIVVEHEQRAMPVDDVGTRTDLLMLALTPGGRERTTGEFRALAAAAGLRWERAVPLTSGDCAYVFQR